MTVKQLTWAMLIVTVLIAVATFAWEHVNGRKSLEIRATSSISLLESDPIMDRLKITYGGTALTSLTKIRFLLVNSGARPISPADVEKAPRIDLGPSCQVLECPVASTSPPGISCELVAPNQGANIAIKLGLLNAGDSVEANVYLTGVPQWPPAVSGRIEGVKRVVFIDQTAAGATVRRTPPKVWFVGGVGALFLLLLPFSVGSARRHRRARRLSGDPATFGGMTETRELAEWVGLNVPAGGLTVPVMRSLEDPKLGIDAARRMVASGLGALSGAEGALVLIAGVFLFCAWYVLRHVLP
jgi:hypothetical protein